MLITAYPTHKITPGETLLPILDEYLPRLSPNSIVVITSKIISLCQNRVVLKQTVANKMLLIQHEADYFLEGDYQKPYGVCLTLKNNLLIPMAGIDESNGSGHYILYPQDISTTATEIWQHLKAKHNQEKLGVLITDSHTTPLRRGVTGIALGWCGFTPLFNYIGKPDIFGSPLRTTQLNIVDALATSAVFVMGEGSEQTPLAIIEKAPKITFQTTPPSQEEIDSITISPEHDLYSPLFERLHWQKKS